MRRFFCRAGVCTVLFCASPRSFFRAVAYPYSSEGRELRQLLRACGS